MLEIKKLNLAVGIFIAVLISCTVLE